MAYYEYEGLDRPRNPHFLKAKSGTARFDSPDERLIFVANPAKSGSTPASAPQPTLRLEFNRNDGFPDLLSFFPLNNVQTFAIDGLSLSLDQSCAILQKMKQISHLHLSSLDIKPFFQAIEFNSPGASTRRRHIIDR